jgi:hypothetical protein
VGGRLDDRFLLRPGELLAACAPLRLLRYRAGIIGEPDRRKAVAGIVAQRSPITAIAPAAGPR